MSKDWEISTVTWIAPWDKEGGDYSETIIDTFANDQKGIWEEYDVTDVTKDFIDNPSTNYGYCVTYPDDDPIIDFGNVSYSSEYSDVTKRPKLTIYYSQSGE